jgi:hypothetical protein
LEHEKQGEAHGADVKPDTIHGDTQAQSGPVFGLSYVVGINLMPRIRNIKDLVLYKADRRRKYKHIDSLCRQSIDWALIERHYLDMMRVAVSIKAGRMTPSTILRRLGSESTKNKLYFAFRELGRVIRTLFLLKYLDNPELRRTIHAATNKRAVQRLRAVANVRRRRRHRRKRPARAAQGNQVQPPRREHGDPVQRAVDVAQAKGTAGEGASGRRRGAQGAVAVPAGAHQPVRGLSTGSPAPRSTARFDHRFRI